MDANDANDEHQLSVRLVVTRLDQSTDFLQVHAPAWTQSGRRA
jgi:hypothetical protein